MCMFIIKYYMVFVNNKGLFATCIYQQQKCTMYIALYLLNYLRVNQFYSHRFVVGGLD